MARTLKITVEVEDDGGDDYDNILQAFRSIGAEIVEEEEI